MQGTQKRNTIDSQTASIQRREVQPPRTLSELEITAVQDDYLDTIQLHPSLARIYLEAYTLILLGGWLYIAESDTLHFPDGAHVTDVARACGVCTCMALKGKGSLTRKNQCRHEQASLLFAAALSDEHARWLEAHLGLELLFEEGVRQ